MEPQCGVCGEKGYWVAWDPKVSDYRCANHVSEEDPRDTNVMLRKLIAAKAKLDAGEELTAAEKEELEEISEFLAEVIKEFMRVLQETLAPAITAIAEAVKSLWDSLPKEIQEFLTEPRKVTMSDLATPYSEAQARVFVPPYDSEARTAQHYTGRGGW